MRSSMFLGLLTFVSQSSVSAQEAQPAEMLAKPYFSQPRQFAEEFTIVSPGDFASKYNAAKQPTLMVFLGRSFSSFVSDWHTNTRIQVNTEIKSTSADLPQTISSDASVQTRLHNTNLSSQFYNSDEWQSLEQGFRETMLKYRVKLLQQNLAARLLDAEVRQSSNRLPQNDNLRLETDVLRKHSKFLIEIVPYQETRQHMQPVGYQISISSLASATLIGEKRLGLRLPKAEYQAGKNGYSLQEVPVNTEYQPGKSGYDAVKTYQDQGYENGKKIGLALIELMYRSGLDGS